MRYLALVALLLTGCATSAPLSSTLLTGDAAYQAIPGRAQQTNANYRVGALDVLNVTVFQEPDLSVKGIQVDASGRIALPLVGSINAKGKTAAELASELEKELSAKYLVDPQVTVTIANSVSQKVSVQGEVTEPGVYQLNGPTTLLDVISLAKGETEIAKLDQVVIFRNVEGQKMGAVFDVDSIRRGTAQDPVIQGNDLVIVGHSAARRFWQNVLRAAPLFNVFTPIP